LPPSFKGGGIDGTDFSLSGENEEAGLKGKGAVIYEPTYDERTKYRKPE